MSTITTTKRRVNRINNLEAKGVRQEERARRGVGSRRSAAGRAARDGEPGGSARLAEYQTGDRAKKDPAIVALTLAEREGLEVFVDLAGNPCAKVPGDRSGRSWPIRSPRVKGYFAYLFYRETEQRLSGRGLTWILTVLEGKAWSAPPRKGDSVWEMLDGDPLARVLVELVRARPYTGPMSCLLSELANLARRRKLLRGGEKLPVLPELLGRKLDELTPLLAEAGIRFERLPRNAHYRPVHVYQASDSPMEMSAIASALAEALVGLDELERKKETGDRGPGEQQAADGDRHHVGDDVEAEHSSITIPHSSFPSASSANGEPASKLERDDATRALLDLCPELLHRSDGWLGMNGR